MVDFMRGRRLRGSAGLRDLVREQRVGLEDLVYPIFVSETATDFEPIGSMPGVSRVPESKLAGLMAELQAEGLKAVMLFGVLADNHKDAVGSDSLREDGLLARMVRVAKQAAPEMVVMADICFCEYTDHGHCGVVHEGVVDNDATLANLANQAVVAARAGADVVAPSAMMDGQVLAIRQALDGAGFGQVPILAYSSKFASALYGPFREAAGCGLRGDRKTYQMDPMNGREALRESLADEAQGADMLMVKPGIAYLDVLSQLRARTLLPLVVYQVSGEYAMVKFAAQAGALDEKRVVRELLGAFKRAGADLIITYFAREVAREIAQEIARGGFRA